MIKEIVVLILVLTLLLAICIFSQLYIIKSSETIRLTLAPIGNAIANDDWQKAQNSYDKASQQWETTKGKWKLLINHDDMRDIEISFVDMGVLLEQKNRDQAQKEFATLLFYLNHVPENERVSISNIL